MKEALCSQRREASSGFLSCGGLFCACLMSLAFFSACGLYSYDDSDRTTIRIAYLPITHSAAVMMLPTVTHYDENFSVELVRFTAWPEVVEALRAGHVDGASLLFEVAVTAFQMGSDWSAISLSHRDGNVLVVDNTVQNVKDLVGRTVAIPHSMSPHMTLLNKVLSDEGMSISDINLIEISPAEMPFSMAARGISAYVVAEPWGSLAEERGAGRILVNSVDVIPGSVCCLLVFGDRALNDHDGLLSWLHENIHLAAQEAAISSEATIEMFRQVTGFDRGIITRSLATTSFDNLTFTAADYLKTIENVLRYGILDEFPAFQDFVREAGR